MGKKRKDQDLDGAFGASPYETDVVLKKYCALQEANHSLCDLVDNYLAVCLQKADYADIVLSLDDDITRVMVNTYLSLVGDNEDRVFVKFSHDDELLENIFSRNIKINSLSAIIQKQRPELLEYITSINPDKHGYLFNALMFTYATVKKAFDNVDFMASLERSYASSSSRPPRELIPRL